MKCAVVSGSNGGIGSAIATAFREAGYCVIGIDLALNPSTEVNHYISVDLEKFSEDANTRATVCSSIQSFAGESGIAALINNAAVQHLGDFDCLSDEAWRASLSVNLLAPMYLARGLLRELSAVRGTIINVSSIHARLSKPGFTAYAASKAALTGLTSAMAVELGDRLQVVAVCPAAISTPMLKAGFERRPEQYGMLAEFHPSRSIGAPAEVAQLILLLASSAVPFYNGMIVNMDGGIGARLHDPT